MTGMELAMSLPDDAIEPGRGRLGRKKSSERSATEIAEGEPDRSRSSRRPEDATLRLIRNTWGGMLVSFAVELDGRHVGELAHGATLKFQLTPGEHQLYLSGGGAFFGTTERFVVDEFDNLTYTVSYSWYGGIKLSKVWE